MQPEGVEGEFAKFAGSVLISTGSFGGSVATLTSNEAFFLTLWFGII